MGRLGSAMVLAAAVAACGGESIGETVPATGGAGGAPGSGGSTSNSGGSGGAVVPPGELGDPMLLHDDLPAGGIAHYLQSEVLGDDLFVCAGVGGLVRFDISDPANLSKKGGVTFGQSERCQYVAIDTEQKLAFVTHAEEQIDPVSFVGVVDISQPSQMTALDVLQRDDQPAGIDFADGVIAVAAKSEGLELFEYGSQLTLVGQLVLDEAWSVQLAGSYAYVMNGASGLAVVDITDPTSPSLVTELDLEAIARDLVLDGERLYAVLGSDGLATIDISDPTAPVLLDTDVTPGSAIDLAIAPDLDALFVADWNDIRLFDLSDPDDPLLLGREPLPEQGQADSESRVMGIATSGPYVFGSNWDVLSSYELVPDKSAPDLVISPPNVLLPGADASETVSATLVLSNDGPRELGAISVTASGDLEVLFAPESIAAYDSAVIEVRYTAPNANPFAGSVTIDSDDIDQPTQTVDVSCNTPGIGVGDLVPSDWSWLDLDGNEIALAQWDGQVKLLAYFSTF